MTQDPSSDVTFHVDPGEVVTVIVTAYHGASLLRASFRGAPPDVANNVPAGTFRFTANGVAADTVSSPMKFACTCGFVPPVVGSSQPFYTRSVAGSSGGSFPLSIVAYDTAPVSFNLYFYVK